MWLLGCLAKVSNDLLINCPFSQLVYGKPQSCFALIEDPFLVNPFPLSLLSLIWAREDAE